MEISLDMEIAYMRENCDFDSIQMYRSTRGEK